MFYFNYNYFLRKINTINIINLLPITNNNTALLLLFIKENNGS